MNTFVLDASAISFFQGAVGLPVLRDVVAVVRCITPKEVVDELDRRPKFLRQFSRWLVSEDVDLPVVRIVEPSPEHELLRRLHPAPEVLKDEGESACIAIASSDPSRTVVCHDKNALWWALRELHPHPRPAIAMHAFLAEIARFGVLTRPQLQALAAAVAQGRVVEPLWWERWLETRD